MKRIKKHDLPSKACCFCGKYFFWRKKWKTCWGEVRFCSHKCKTNNAQIKGYINT